MTPTRAQIDSWNPASLNAIADAWIALDSKSEDLFTRYVDSVTKVNGTYWEGKTAEAAQDRANADKKTAVEVIDVLEALAKTAQQGFHEIDAPLRRARLAVVAAESDRFLVADSLALTDLTAEPDAARVALLQERQRELTDAANAAETADNNIRSSLAAARDGLRVKFISAATSGGQQGNSDFDAMAKHPGSMTPEQLQRISESGHLTPEQAAALERVDTAAIPASQMEYLNQLSRSLDGKSPQQIEDLLSKLPPDARASVANSLQILSNEHVTASVEGDSEIPTKGGLDSLPDKMRESLTRDDMVTGDFQVSGQTFTRTVELNGVADNLAIADIVAMGDDQYKTGSELDKSLLEAGRQYLNAEVAQEQLRPSDRSAFFADGGTPDKGFTEQIFAAVGDDKIAVEAAVSNPEHRSDFVKDMLSHNWTDDGKAASTLFEFADGDATIENPNDPTDVATATYAGSIMEAVAKTVSAEDSWKLLSNVPEVDGQSAGRLNPDLLQTVSKSLSTYMLELAGRSGADVAGFDSSGWADADRNNQYKGSANVFALMNTDDEAGRMFTQAAIAEQLASEGRYAAAPNAPDAGAELMGAGRLHGLMDRGMLEAVQDQYDDKAAQAQAIYDRKEAAYTALSALGSAGIDKLPGGEFINLMVDASGDSLQESIIGKAPDGAAHATLTPPNFYRDYCNILRAVPELPAEFRTDYGDLFDESGALKDWDSITSKVMDPTLRNNAYETMLKMLSGKHDGHQIRDTYEDVVRLDG
ncbi:hypothetical protein [Rhodococcus sp. IEGM 1379]|uniref:TPR repeat region-containing protein n=1 Tax=Rhodococcus sp. IEGM 1379 TaxID=3047086 RepID=UPI0024B7B3E5|nr:hypothetical protein [Rhodococcus sp. IEGM 1379]MDI9917194.1 hypothetical protein [Rhodococcus sp. IEGM 1379]